VNESVASRRRVWFGIILTTAFLLLGFAALLPAHTPSSLRVDQAGADETVPAPAPTTSIAAPTTGAPATTTATAAAVAAAPPSTTSTTIARPQPTAPPTTAAPVVKAALPPVVAPGPSPTAAQFLACVRQRESHGDYRAVSASGTFRGAYQFAQSSWDLTARHAGRTDLVGVLPDQASPADQDALALSLYLWQGTKPWGGACS
jgi:hypothetical protein